MRDLIDIMLSPARDRRRRDLRIRYRIQVVSAREVGNDLAPLVDTAILLRIENQLHRHATIDRRLQPQGHRLVAKLIEGTQNCVAALGLVNELEQSLIKVATEPLQSPSSLGSRQLVEGFLLRNSRA